MQIDHLKAIFYRNYIMLRSSFVLAIVFSTLSLVLKTYLKATNKMTMAFIIIVSIYIFQRTLILNFIEDKVLKFKGMFKIMGMDDISYLIAQMLSNFFFMLIFVGLAFGTFLIYDGFNLHAFEFIFIFSSLLFSLALINFNLFLSLFFRNPILAADISNMVCFIINLISLLLIFAESNYTFLINFIPNTPYYSIVKKLVMNSDNLKFESIQRELIILVIHAIIYVIFYYIIDRMIEDDYGMNKSVWELAASVWTQRNENNEQLIDDEENNESQTSNVILSLRSLVKKFDEQFQLGQIDVEIKKGEMYCLLGPNGSGKTTFLNVISGLYKRSKGTIIYKGETIPITRNLTEVGFCSADNILMDSLTVYQHFRLFCLIKHIKDIETVIPNMMNLFGLKKYENFNVNELSGGNKRKLCIALAYIGKPDLLLLDEPSSSLDPFSKRDIFNVLLKIQQTDKCTVIISSHNFDEAEYFPDNIIMLSKGQILLEGNLKRLKEYFGSGFELRLIPKTEDAFSENLLTSIKNEINDENVNVAINLHDLSIFLPHEYLNKVSEIYKQVKKKFGDLYTIEFSSNLVENILQTKKLKEMYNNDNVTGNLINNIVNNMQQTTDSPFSLKVKVLMLGRIKFLYENYVQLTTFALINMFLFLLIIYFFLFMAKLAPDMSLNNCMFLFATVFVSVEGYNNFLYPYLLVYERQYSIKKLFICNGVTLNQYFGSRLVADLMINSIAYAFLLSISYIAIYTMIIPEVLVSQQVILMLVTIFLWKNCFIINSYFISFIFNNTSSVTKNFYMIYFCYSVCFLALSHLLPFMYLLSDFYYIYNIAVNYENITDYIWIIIAAPLFQIAFYYCVILYIENYKLSFNYINSEERDINSSAVKRVPSKRFIQKVSYDHFGKDYEFEIDNLRKVYNHKKVVLKKLNLKLSAGTCLGLIGPNGAGKSTFFDILIAETEKTCGSILFNKKSDLIPFEHYNFAVSLQKNSLYAEFTVEYHFKLYAKLLNIKNPSIIENLIDFFDLNQHLKQKIYELPHGVRRKICLALSLIRRPDFILYDEATTGIDVFSCQKIQRLLKAIEYSYGSIMIVTTHLMREVDFLCDDIGILVDGDFIEYGGVNEIKLNKSPQLIKIVPSASFNKEQFESHLGQYCDVSYSKRNSAQLKHAIYELNNGKGEWLEQVILFLEEERNERHIEAFELTRTSLEDLFIDMILSVKGDLANIE